MEQTSQPPRKPTTYAEVQERGRALQHRFRVAGIPQYTRWFVDHYPRWKGDATRMERIRLVFNGQGSMADADLLVKCEVIANENLPRVNPNLTPSAIRA